MSELSEQLPRVELSHPVLELSQQLLYGLELSEQLSRVELSLQLVRLELSLVSAETPLVLTIHEYDQLAAAELAIHEYDQR